MDARDHDQRSPAEHLALARAAGVQAGGWYSYDGLENGGVPSADLIVPELQQVEVGDLFAWTPEAYDGFIVKAVEPGRARHRR
jgi:hypothetical protein